MRSRLVPKIPLGGYRVVYKLIVLAAPPGLYMGVIITLNFVVGINKY